MLEHCQLDGSVGLRDSDGAAEIPHRLGRVAASSNAAEGWHARIVPSAYPAFLHQLQQLALAQQSVGKVQAVELNLPRGKNPQLLDEPGVERAMIFELESAEGMRDPLDGVRLPMRIVVHRTDAPLAAGAVMLGVQDAIHHRIAKVKIRRAHVDLRPEDSRAVGKLSGAHALKQI